MKSKSRRAVALITLVLAAVGTATPSRGEPGPYDAAYWGWSAHHPTSAAHASADKTGAMAAETSIGSEPVPALGSASAWAGGSIVRIYRNLIPGQTYLATATLSTPTSGAGAPSATGAPLSPATAGPGLGSRALVSVSLVAVFLKCDPEGCGGGGYVKEKALACTPGYRGWDGRPLSCANPGQFTVSEEVTFSDEAGPNDYVEVEVNLDCWSTIDTVGGRASASAALTVVDISLEPVPF